MFQAFLRYSGQSVTELIFIFPCCPGRRKDVMVPPILLEVGIESQCQSAGDRKQQTHTGSGRVKQDADENGERHAKEHPGQTGLVMAFVNVTKSGHDAHQVVTIPSVLNIRR